VVLVIAKIYQMGRLADDSNRSSDRGGDIGGGLQWVGSKENGVGPEMGCALVDGGCDTCNSVGEALGSVVLRIRGSDDFRDMRGAGEDVGEVGTGILVACESKWV
jgi:hypothetical protein